MAFLEISGLKKRFGAVEVLKGIDIALDKAGFLVLVGPSGCGKTTLLNMIAGLETISDGEIRIDNQRVNELHPKDRDIAMVFQSYALYPTMSVHRNIGFGLEMRGMPAAERDAAVRRAAALLQDAVLHDRDERAERHRLDLVMRHIDDRGAERVVQPFDLGAHFHTQL
ncbi:MAG TPA: ABC transporter ATP-binding protein, partial [Hyphomicrobiaceae bacterium]|nr:ABC transporter ATP-binding protein [Hyphomicrobiaceae bacterium]